MGRRRLGQLLMMAASRNSPSGPEEGEGRGVQWDRRGREGGRARGDAGIITTLPHGVPTGAQNLTRTQVMHVQHKYGTGVIQVYLRCIVLCMV